MDDVRPPKRHLSLSAAGQPACGQLGTSGDYVYRTTDDVTKVTCDKCLASAGIKKIKRRTAAEMRAAEVQRWQKYVDDAAAKGRVYQRGIDELEKLGAR